MASIEVRTLREALVAGRLSPLEVMIYIRAIRRELREVERLALGALAPRLTKRQHRH
jgi:hypothetical protein